MFKSKAKRIIPLSEPQISGREWEYVKDCLDSGWVSSVGSYVEKFENMMAGYVGNPYAVAVVNGTGALHLSLLASGVNADDEVLVPALTFVATANVIRYCQASPVFMDCDPQTLNLDVDKAIDFLRKECGQDSKGFLRNKRTKKRIRAIIPVHVFGHPVDMDDLSRVCLRNKITVIEDATESLGSEYKGRKTGSLGTLGCFSFNGNKIITCGGGGMVVTRHKDMAESVRHLSTQAKKDPLEYDHDEVGYNYRLTNLQAAVGVGQLEQLKKFLKKKRQHAEFYRKYLSDTGTGELLWEKPWAKSNFWLCTFRVPKQCKKGLQNFLWEKGVGVRSIWRPIHMLPMYKKCQAYAVGEAVRAYECCFNLPSSIGLGQEDLGYVVDNIRFYFRHKHKGIK